MKKFLIAGTMLAIAGIGVGVARRHESPAPVVEAAATTTTAAPATSTTMAALGSAKVATKTTPTTARRATNPPTTATPAAPTTTTTRAATTSTTTTTTARQVQNCTVTAATPTVRMGEPQTISMVSNMPGTRVAIQITWSASYLRTAGDAVTDSSGSVTNTFTSRSGGKVDVTIFPYDAADHRASRGLCSTTFQSTS